MLKQKATFVPQRGDRSPALSPVRRETVQSNSWCIACPYVCSDCRVLLYAAVTLTLAVIFLFFKHVCCVDFTFLLWHRLMQLLKPASNSDENLPPTGCTLATSFLILFFFVVSFQVTELIYTVVLSCFFCVAFVCVVYGCVGWPMPPGVVVLVFCVFCCFLFFAIQSQCIPKCIHNTTTVPSKPLQICQPQRQVISLALKKPIIHILI